MKWVSTYLRPFNILAFLLVWPDLEKTPIYYIRLIFNPNISPFLL
jgi:hypothetical protein